MRRTSSMSQRASRYLGFFVLAVATSSREVVVVVAAAAAGTIVAVDEASVSNGGSFSKSRDGASHHQNPPQPYQHLRGDSHNAPHSLEDEGHRNLFGRLSEAPPKTTNRNDSPVMANVDRSSLVRNDPTRESGDGVLLRHLALLRARSTIPHTQLCLSTWNTALDECSFRCEVRGERATTAGLPEDDDDYDDWDSSRGCRG